MIDQFIDRENNVHLRVFIKALHGVRSTLKHSMPEYAVKMTDLIDMPRETHDQVCIFLLMAHDVVIKGRDDVYKLDEEASSLLDAIHNIPYGLLGRFNGTWDWKASLQDIFVAHENRYLSGLKKYSGLLTENA